MADKSVFAVLNGINVNGHTEQKNGLTYLSWAWAWGELKKHYPEAIYTIYENVDGWNYFTDGRTAWVKTGVTVEGIEHIEYLPVMDFKNRSIPADSVTSFDVNKSIQRSLTKAVARHGLGLYIYAGEDLPEAEVTHPVCDDCGAEIKAEPNVTVPQILQVGRKQFGLKLCYSCIMKRRGLLPSARMIAQVEAYGNSDHGN